MLVALAILGCSGGTLEGRVVDGLTGAPVAGQHVLAQATEAAGMSCTSFDAVTDAEGRFRFEGTCPVGYALRPSGDDLWFAANDVIAADHKGELALELWRAPSSPGVYRLANGEFEVLRTPAEMKIRGLPGTAEKISYPSRIPEKLPVIGAGEHLVVVGRENTDTLAPMPLVPAPALRITEGELVLQQPEWAYLGVKITPPSTVEPVPAAFDAGKVRMVEKGERAVKFVAHDALAPGRYALASPGDRRVYLLDFSVPGSAPGGAAPAGDATAPAGADPAGEAPPGTPPG